MNETFLGKIVALVSATDEQNMWKVHVADDSQAFAKLLEKWEGPIQRLCTRMLGDSHRAEDLTQETFARLYSRRKDYVPSGKFSTYLWRIALNICYDELRKLKRRGESRLHEMTADEEELPARMICPGPNPTEAAECRERAEEVRAALDQLPDGYRTVVILRHYENLKFREIAEVLQIPEGTVKSRMAEGLMMLARTLRVSRDRQVSRMSAIGSDAAIGSKKFGNGSLQLTHAI